MKPAGENSPSAQAIAVVLRDIAAALKLGDESAFRVAAYERGADAIAAFGGDLARAIADGTLTKIAGIGAKLAATIAEIYATGTAQALTTLSAGLPPGALALARGPHLSLRAITTLSEAHIRDLDALYDAAKSGRLATLPGFTVKTEARILKSLQEEAARRGRLLLSDALTAAAEVQGHLPGIAVDVVGDVRRGIEVVDVVELVAASDDPEQALDRFVASQAMVVERREPGFVEARLLEGARVRLWSVASAARAAALQRLTGSAEHNRAVDLVATRAGLTIALDGVRRASTLVAVADEPALYELLRLQFVAPTLRSGDSEVQEAAEERLPRLITADDIQGMVHCHTTYSDGRNTVLEMARAAQERGMKYITITDHSPTAFYARGVEIDRLRRQWDEIAAAQEQVTIRILRGTESDILKDGALDYPDAILDELDVIIASIHSRYSLDEAATTARIIAALKQPRFKIWGHALGRMLLHRPPVACDVERILEVAAEERVAIEINGDPHRLDLAPEWARRAAARGIPFVVSVDAHSTRALDYLRYGILMAQRARLTADQVLNTRDADGFLAAVRPGGLQTG